MSSFSGAAPAEAAPAAPTNHGNTVYLDCPETIAEDSEQITANERMLVRGTDYTIDYATGTVVFLDGKLLAAGTAVTISNGISASRNDTHKTGVLDGVIIRCPFVWNPATKQFDQRFGVLRGPLQDTKNSPVSPLRVSLNGDGTLTFKGAAISRADLKSALMKEYPGHGLAIILSGPKNSSVESLRSVIGTVRDAKYFWIRWDPSINPQMEEIIQADGR